MPDPGRIAAPALDPSFQRLKQLILDRTGHHYFIDKDDALWERILRRLRKVRDADATAYLQRLSDPATADSEWPALEAEITIGETFFFRYAEQFEALRRTILPEIIERRAAERRLRIWSAGCANGAEAYSLAIIVHELLGEALPDWRISILGTDINDSFLAAAREARYGSWALRSLGAEERSRFFLSEQEGKAWRVRPQYRGLARFERHNLLSLLDGSSPLQLSGFDLILCRNVLIYFHSDVSLRIVEALSRCLDPAGWLLVGHAEPSPAFNPILDAVGLPSTTAYRPKGTETTSRDSALPVGLPALPAGKLESPPRQPRPVRPSPRRRAAEPIAAATPAASPDESLAAIYDALARRDLARARSLCRAAIADRPIDPLFHYLDALAAREQERNEEAETAFRRAVYLDKSFAMAHFHLGLLLLDTGRQASGRRSLMNAMRLAAALPAATPLAHGDGMTAADLVAAARLRLGLASAAKENGR